MFRTIQASAIIFAALLTPVIAEEVDDVHAEMTAAFGGVPTFVGGIADAALPGLWKTAKEFQFNPDTALDPKTKALISLAVSAQIPCEYCIWQDTGSAKTAGATDQEIAEAVAIAAMTRAWSTIFHGTQTDFDTFQAELGGN